MPTQKIAIFISFYGNGGAERVLFDVAQEMLRQGVRVDVVVCKNTPNLQEALPQGASLHMLNRHPALSLLALRRYLKTHKPHGVISTLIWPNVVNVLAKRLFKLPHATIVREANSLPHHFAFRPFVQRFVAAWLVRHYYPKANCVVAVSQEAQAHLQRFLNVHESNVVAIANPINIVALQTKAQQPCEHEWLATPNPAQPVLLAVGRLTPQKAFDVLLQAFDQLSDAHRLIILGDGPSRPALVALAHKLGVSGRVDFVGFQPNPFAYMAKADVFVLSSLHEGMPNVLLQALACGCKIVSTSCPSGPTELLQPQGFGTLVEAGNANALAQGIAKTLQHTPDMPARNHYLQRHQLAEITAQYLRAAGLQARQG